MRFLRQVEVARTAHIGVMYMLAEYGTFALANTLAFGNINPPQLAMIPVGAACSLFGMGIGILIRRRRAHHAPDAE